MSILNRNSYKINNLLIVEYIKGKRYVFYRGNIVGSTEHNNKKMSDNNNIIYSALFVNDIDALKKRYKPIHKNEFYHHSTIQFNPQIIDNNLMGKTIELDIVGRFINDKVDLLLVSNDYSTKEHPHITLSTAEGVNAHDSDTEIKNNPNKINHFSKLIKRTKSKIFTTYGYFSPIGTIKTKHYV